MKRTVVETGGVGSVGKGISPAGPRAWRGAFLCTSGRPFHRGGGKEQSTRRSGAIHRDSVETSHPWTLLTIVSIVVFTSTLVFIFCSTSFSEWMTVEWSRPPNILPITGSEELVSWRQMCIAIWRG
jgi:hypothetical protein